MSNEAGTSRPLPAGADDRPSATRATIRGLVVDEHDRPVPGAEVLDLGIHPRRGRDDRRAGRTLRATDQPPDGARRLAPGSVRRWRSPGHPPAGLRSPRGSRRRAGADHPEASSTHRRAGRPREAGTRPGRPGRGGQHRRDLRPGGHEPGRPRHPSHPGRRKGRVDLRGQAGARMRLCRVRFARPEAGARRGRRRAPRTGRPDARRRADGPHQGAGRRGQADRRHGVRALAAQEGRPVQRGQRLQPVDAPRPPAPTAWPRSTGCR